MISFDSVCFVKWSGSAGELVRRAASGLAMSRGTAIGCPRVLHGRRLEVRQLSPRPAWPISASRAWGWETPRGWAGAAFFLVAATTALGNWLRPGPGRLSWPSDARPTVASLASASAKVLLASVEIRLGLPGLLLSASGDELDLLAPAFGHPRLFLRRLPSAFGSCHAETGHLQRMRPVFANQLWVWMFS